MPASRPDWLQTAVVSTPNGTTSDALVVADLAHVLWAVNLGCLGFHVWPTRAADLDHADELRIDLDPTPGVTFDDGAGGGRRGPARSSTRSACWPCPRPPATGASTSTSASQPRWTSYEVRPAAVAVARELERRRPDLITAAWWKEERGTRVFVDFNQNAPHKTIFGAWSRAGPGRGAGVDPVRLGRARRRIDPDAPHHRHRARRGWPQAGDPWAPMDDRPQSLEPVLDLHRRDQAAGLLDRPLAARLSQERRASRPGSRPSQGPQAVRSPLHQQPGPRPRASDGAAGHGPGRAGPRRPVGGGRRRPAGRWRRPASATFPAGMGVAEHPSAALRRLYADAGSLPPEQRPDFMFPACFGQGLPAEDAGRPAPGHRGLATGTDRQRGRRSSPALRPPPSRGLPHVTHASWRARPGTPRPAAAAAAVAPLWQAHGGKASLARRRLRPSPPRHLSDVDAVRFLPPRAERPVPATGSFDAVGDD
ncbi:MAG: hypothetical protein WKG07_46105 [Hymenobacter sp.]